MTGLSELLPCPHCGGGNISSVHIRDGRSIVCRDCGASMRAFQPDAETAARAAWNRRISPSQRQAVDVVEALRALVEMRKGVVSDVYAAHQYRGNGASEWMREDDRDFRRELEKAFDDAAAALASLAPQGGERCSDCPPVGYPTDETRCLPCDRRAAGDCSVEAIAKVISLSYGENPDDDAPLTTICGPNNEPLPNWTAYTEQAEAVRAWIASIYASPQAANPAQVTDASDLDYGLKLIAEAIDVHFGDRDDAYLYEMGDTTIHDVWDTFDALTAAIGAGSQAVADDPVSFQWKTIDGWVECNASGSQQRRREYALSMAQQIGLGYRKLYALSQPHPADEWVVEALERMVALYESEYDADVPFVRPDWLVAALAAKEGR